MLVALQVYRETGRRVQFLVAAHSMQRRFIGFFARLIRSSMLPDFFLLTGHKNKCTFLVPVVRAQDNAKPGSGLVSLSEEDPCLVLGHGTHFLTEFKPRMQIMLPKSVGATAAEVAEVISDDRLRIKKEFSTESSKSTAGLREKLRELRGEGREGLEYKKLPHVNQEETYQDVYKALNQGGSIVIFPEGKRLQRLCLYDI
jgi:glycerol-3-phosphate O-acyltransferase / dihydroxyacetone phosphate acyltransferase